MKRLAMVLALLLATMFGCKSTKDKFKKDTDRQLTETTTTTITKPGDTVKYIVPNIVLKDTTIYKKNTVTGTTQILRYNNEGRLTEAECISALTTIVQENHRQLLEVIEESQKHKEEEISPAIILYVFIGFAILMITAVAILGVYMSKYGKAIKALAT